MTNTEIGTGSDELENKVGEVPSRSHGLLMRRIGVIGDVHGKDETLKLGLDILKARACDVLLCVGDIADGTGSVDECCRLLNDNGVETVRGNHDRWLFESRMRRLPNATQMGHISNTSKTYLGALPPVRYFGSPIGTLMLCHGLAEDDMWRPPLPGKTLTLTDRQIELLKGVSLVLQGHTHRCGLIDVPIPRTMLLNVGSLQGAEPTVTFLDLAACIGEHLKVPGEGVLERFLLRRE